MISTNQQVLKLFKMREIERFLYMKPWRSVRRVHSTSHPVPLFEAESLNGIPKITFVVLESPTCSLCMCWH